MTLTLPTLLVISSPMGVPLYSARGLNQDITPVQAAKPQPRYTVNGELTFLGMSQMQRYQSVITCTDQDAPAFGGIWPGTVVLVDCVPEFSYLTMAGAPTGWPAKREIISGSQRVVGSHTYYRIRSEFMVVDWDSGHDEYPHTYQWRLTLQETGAAS